MFALAIDVQKIIIEFLDPREIKNIYESRKDAEIMFDELTKHTNFIVDCKRIISDEELKWYKAKNIKLKLLETFIEVYKTKLWYQNGKLHRENDLPAKINNTGDQFWYKNGERHRDNDFPAVIFSNGDQLWYQDGMLHRDNDLPAVIFANGYRAWYKKSKRHRDNDLPAVIHVNGEHIWYKNGNEYDLNK
jgi:hypothetical protein